MRYSIYPILLFSLLLFTGLGCKQVDDLTGGGVEKPTVAYSSTNFDAEFYKAGSSVTPSLDWNGEQGSVSLGTSLEGLSINSTTGKLEWTKLLPSGTHQVDVVVSNSEGQVVVPVTIDNPFRGTFDGTYGSSNDFKLEILPDGTITLFADGEEASGTWVMNGEQFTAYYTYNNYPDLDYSLIADIDQTNSGVTISGNYYYGQYAPGDDPVDVFEVSLE